jgi:DNA (cytosine-5)-methyltransferase 1
VAYATNEGIHERWRPDDAGEIVQQLSGDVGNGVPGGRQEKETVLADSDLQHGKWGSQSQQPSSVSGESWNQSSGCGAEVADTSSIGQQRQRQSWFGSDPAEAREGETDHAFAERVGHIWGIESPVGRVAHGVAARVDRLKAIGNGQVPICAAKAFKILSGMA